MLKVAFYGYKIEEQVKKLKWRREVNTTPIYEAYKNYEGIKLIDFGGWDLPVNFKAGIIAEHNAVRNAAGMFDVSHMGECLVEGPGARAFLDSLVTNDVSTQPVGRALYAIMCYENGTCVDDLILYCLKEDLFFVVMNASNVEKDLDWIMAHKPTDGVKITDLSAKTAQIAIQGPTAVDFVSKLIPNAKELGFFGIDYTSGVLGKKCIVGRTGYTGEDGFEIYCAAEDGPEHWNAFYEMGVQPCGLGARDTLRLEAKLPLYGHEISDSITPLEANLGTFVKLDKNADFIGKAALLKQQEEGIPRSLRGFEMVDGGVARNSYPVLVEGREVGYVTSGCKSPTLDKFVGYALMERKTGLKFGDTIEILIHGKPKKAVLVKTPFYKRGKRNDNIVKA